MRATVESNSSHPLHNLLTKPSLRAPEVWWYQLVIDKSLSFVAQRKAVKVMLLLIIAALVSVVGYFVYLQFIYITDSGKSSLSAENWKKFNNQYFSFSYPSQWIVEDGTESWKPLTNAELSLGVHDGREKNFQTLNIRLYSSSQFSNTLLEKNSNKELLEKAIQNDNLADFIIHSRYSCREDFIICRRSQYRSFVDINNKKGYAFLAIDNNSTTGIHIVKILFLSNQKVFELTVNDASRVPIDSSPSKDHADILKAIDDKMYGKIIRSLQFK